MMRLPIFCDLDGTLITADSLWDTSWAILVTRPWLAPRLGLKLAAGRGQLRDWATSTLCLPTDWFQQREAVVSFLREAHADGVPLVLATGADRRIAEAIASKLGVFSDVLASAGGVNLVGPAKLAAVQAYAREHGWPDWAYMGDSRQDRVLWQEACECLVVGSLSLVPARRRNDATLIAPGAKDSPLTSLVRAWQRRARVRTAFTPQTAPREASSPSR